MDDIITLIFIVIAILSIFGKTKFQKKKAAKSSHSGGWFDMLTKYMADTEKKTERQSTQGSSQWDQLMDDNSSYGSQTDDYDDSIEDLEIEEFDIPSPPEEIMSAPSVSEPVTLSDTGDLTEEKPELLTMRRKKTSWAATMTKSREDLRRAVILSEIIGPPVALRNPFE